MIIKNLTRNGKSGAGTLIKYLFKYILHPEKSKHQIKPENISKSDIPFIHTHNIRSKNIAGFIKEFDGNSRSRLNTRSGQTVCHHIILSWARADAKKLTDAKLKAIIKKFIELRGKDLIYVFSKHNDKEHIHLHGAIGSARLNGLSSRVSKATFAEIKTQLDTYQKEMFPELISLPNHGAKRNKSFSAALGKNPIITSRESKKISLLKLIEQCHRSGYSEDKLLKTLQKNGHSPYYRNGKLTGVRYASSDVKFRFTNLNVLLDKEAVLTSIQNEKSKESTKQNDTRNTLDELRKLRYGKDKSNELIR
ncbi:relaxase/mobilization nuclease domain-containing protein [Sediminibacterium sp.]|uniref:relaxase/mobilization nuclease domain-containing protein n=1 Tax=Sediminibacterium sp. TaxID=1917865 RepID=UPI003F69A047